jgi:hypothetical protein
MLRRWPAEFIHAFTTAAAVGWPFAMFSPAVRNLAPVARIRSPKLVPLRLVCEK